MEHETTDDVKDELDNKRSVKPKINEEELGISPFLYTLEIEVLFRSKSNKFIQDKEGLKLNENYLQEAKPYTKVFIGSEERLMMSRLSNNAKSLFLWIMYEVKAGEDYLWINKKRYMEENDIKSYNTYIAAYKELIRYCIISQTRLKDVYWISPIFLFNGSRIKKYPNNFKLKNPEDAREYQ